MEEKKGSRQRRLRTLPTWSKGKHAWPSFYVSRKEYACSHLSYAPFGFLFLRALLGPVSPAQMQTSVGTMLLTAARQALQVGGRGGEGEGEREEWKQHPHEQEATKGGKGARPACLWSGKAPFRPPQAMHYPHLLYLPSLFPLPNPPSLPPSFLPSFPPSASRWTVSS